MIASSLYLEKSTVNRNLDRLIANGWIVKQDNLTINTSLNGKKHLENIIPEWDKAMLEINTILDQEGIKALDVVMHKLTA